MTLGDSMSDQCVRSVGANVEITLGASVCDQCMRSVCVVILSSGCDQWVGSMAV